MVITASCSDTKKVGKGDVVVSNEGISAADKAVVVSAVSVSALPRVIYR